MDVGASAGFFSSTSAVVSLAKHTSCQGAAESTL